MEKFTKGEWRQSHREKQDGMYSTEVYDEEGKTICTLAWHKVPIEGGFTTDREANAKLIAAAPLMYEQLLSIVDGSAFDKESGLVWEHRLDAIREALKKATE